MNQATEIRKMPPGNVRELVQTLEYNDSWKRLMEIIPRKLEKDDYVCDLKSTNVRKYHTDHFRLIEDASRKFRRACAEILLEEWGTSGRILPALGHLLHLLKRAQLFRAADYIAALLHLETPERPDDGPAAAVTIVLPSDSRNNFSDTIENNLERNNSIKAAIPKIVVTADSTEDQSDMIVFSQQSYNVPIMIDEVNQTKVSDLMKFSQTIDDLSSSCEEDLPDLSVLNHRSENLSEIPDFSQILNTTSSGEVSSEMIPDLNRLQKTNESEMPQFSALMQNTEGSRPNCSSPLPNLSLDTLLPHFSYNELEIATRNFDETPHKNSTEMENSLDESNGRFLGSGAFGSVYLAIGLLLDKPIAVKKLYLDTIEVSVDDAITKQFRNEVEVLSKYKHENILSICGYSCDGSTYCLMYDYISGGALNCRLEKNKEQLNWKDRFRIAMETAEAVSYLHTAMATPLIHRDIKTANILLDCSNKPKLGDFGIIKLIPTQHTAISTTVIGTSIYMAPEAFRSGDVSVKTDTFSFGVVILELLTALPPFDENRDCRDLISHVEEECEGSIAPLLDSTAGTWVNDEDGGTNVAERLFEIALKCLEEKKKRPNMVEVKEFLLNVMS